MAFGLDAVDRRILALLVEDGRMPAAEIARRVGDVSERSIRYRIRRLKQSAVVRISAIVNPASLGYATIGDVAIDVAPGSLQDVAARLVDLDQVSYVAGSVGDGDPWSPGLRPRPRRAAAPRERGHRRYLRSHPGAYHHRSLEAERSV